MPSTPWAELPEAVRDVALTHTGPLFHVRDVAVGSHCHVAAMLLCGDRRVFVKGLRVGAADELTAWMLRNEARVQPHLGEVAPRLLWQVEVDDWHLLGFEHIDGRPADLQPDSADLPRVATALDELSRGLTPSPVPVRGLDQRWGNQRWWPTLAATETLHPWDRCRFTELAALEARAPGLVAGDTLCHTDPVPDNWIIQGDQVRLVDWAWPGTGAPWVDTSFVAIRLVYAGHAPASAAAWAATVPAWRDASHEAITAHAATVLALWIRRARQNAGSPDLVSAARAWTAYLMS